MQNINRSLAVFGIALSTPFLVWILLYSVSQRTENGFDPNPWVQEMVQHPETLRTTSSSVQWVPVHAEGDRFVVGDSSSSADLTIFQPTAEKIIFVIDAQGSTAAQRFHDWLKEKNLLSRSLILSSSDGFLKDLRFFDPNLTLGAGQAYVIRFRILQQLALEGLMTINMSGVWLKPSLFPDSLQPLTDLFLSKKVPVFIGPVSPAEAASLPKNANILISP